jgi:hypothetical protein
MKRNAYDLLQGFKGFNRPCPKCGKQIDRRSSPYEPIGFIEYCTCRRIKHLTP